METWQKLLFLLTCTFNGFTCGTLYLYSIYGPSIASRLNYSGSDSSLMAVAGTVGIAVTGVPASLIIESKGFCVSVLMGGLSVGSGYLGLKGQYSSMSEDDQGTGKLWLSILYVFLTGCGSTLISSCLVKCSAVTFPANRGVATSFPIASYGLSAFVYSSLKKLWFQENISGFLGLLGWTCLGVPLLSLPVFYYADLVLKRGSYGNSRVASLVGSPRASNINSIELQNLGDGSSRAKFSIDELFNQKKFDNSSEPIMLKKLSFWIFFLITGNLVSLGQMYIYSVGFMIKALINSDDNSEIQQHQQFEVSLLSIFNCSGRLFCGILGDIISNQLGKSRLFILFFPATCLLIVQVLGIVLKDEHELWIMSLLNGFGYGSTWASAPQILIELFGVNSLSFGWGVVNLAPIAPAYFLTHWFGAEYDSNSVNTADGDSATNGDGSGSGSINFVCLKGKQCYNGTFHVSTVVACVTFGLAIWLVVRKTLSQNKKYSSV